MKKKLKKSKTICQFKLIIFRINTKINTNITNVIIKKTSIILIIYFITNRIIFSFSFFFLNVFFVTINVMSFNQTDKNLNSIVIVDEKLFFNFQIIQNLKLSLKTDLQIKKKMFAVIYIMKMSNRSF